MSGGGIGSIVGSIAGNMIAPGIGGSIGAAIGGAAGSAIGGDSLTSSSMGTSTSSSSTPNVPSWMLPYLQQNAAAANTLATQPYQPYTGQQVAGLTGMQNQAGQLTQQLATNNPAAAGFQQANQIQSSVANQGLNGINPQTIQNYMNPYTQQVMNASNLRQQQQYQLENNQLQAQQGQTGAFGGSRAALAQGQLYNNFSQQLSQNEATSLSNNFTNAENMAMQGMGQANTAASGIMQGAAGTQTASLQNIGALQTAGGLEQTNNQNNLNAQYQDYLTAQAYPYQQLQNSQNILNPIASLTTGTNATGFNQQTGSPSILQSALGLGATGASLANSIGGSSSGLGFGNIFNSAVGNAGLALGMQPAANGQGAIADAAWQQAYSESDKTGGMVGRNLPGFMNGGMIPHGMYADGGQVSAPTSWRDNVNHMVGSLAQHFESGGLVQTTVPGIPTQYGISAHQTPYTNQKPKYLIPAYAKGGMVNLDHKYHNAQGVPYTHMDGPAVSGPAMKKGGQIPLQTGLTNAGIGGIKRERQHWGQPYVPQDKSAQGYLRPNVKNAFSHGGLVAHYGIPAYDDGGPVDPLALSSGAIYADMAMQNAPTDATNEPSLVDAMLSKAKSMFSSADQDPVSSNGIALPTPRPLPDAIPDAGGPPSGVDSGKGFDAGTTPSSDSLGSKIDSLFKSITGDDTPAKGEDPMKEWQDAQVQRQAELAKTGQLANNNSNNPPSLNGKTVDEALGFTAPGQVKTPADANAAFARVKAMNGQAPIGSMSMKPMANTDDNTVAAQPDMSSMDTNKKMTPEDVQDAVMKRIMDRQQSGINLPLLSMGAAILGDRSNSIMGALGAGEKAYVGTSQEQNKSDLDALHQMAMSNYYSARANSTEALTGARKAEMEAKTAKYVNDVKTNGAKANPYSAAYVRMKAQNPFMPDDQIESELQKAGYTAPNATGAAPSSGNISEEQYNLLPSGASYLWNGQTLTKK